MRLLIPAHGAQDRGHGAFAGGKNCAREQDLHRLEHSLGKQGRECYD